MKIIDAHHHFWYYNPVEYDWIDDHMAGIRRDFQPEDLQQEIDSCGVEGVVSVQARQTIEETDWLLQLAAGHDFIRGVVGWLPLTDRYIEARLEQYAGYSRLKGLRHVIQGEPDPEFMLRKEFHRGISLLQAYGFVYDILISEHQLPNTIRFVDRHPDQQFVLDHLAKPKISMNEIAGWETNLRALARRENVACKISGMVTEADFTNWTEEQLQPYLEVVLDAFGPSRLLFGSDWPVCLAATNYSDWLGLVKKAMSRLSRQEQEQIFSKNAMRIYQLDLPCNR